MPTPEQIEIYAYGLALGVAALGLLCALAAIFVAMVHSLSDRAVKARRRSTYVAPSGGAR